jgi:5-hydroxyisourate hydrolase-like protein (transthyretin family)
MYRLQKAFVALFVFCAFVAAPLVTSAKLDGINTNRVKVKVYTKQGGDWFRALTTRTDGDGVLKFKNALPGWYKMEIDDDDVTTGQYLAVKLRMTDVKGRKLKEKTDVDLYYKNSNDQEIFIQTVDTDKDGWFKMENLSPDVEYKLEISKRDTSHVSKKDNCVRIKTKTKVDDSDWFYSKYDRTDENKVFEAENVLPGKYKFKYKTGDQSEAEPFTLKIRLRNEDGEKIKEVASVDLYAYVNKQKVLVGTMPTDAKGWVTIPGVMTNMKYKIDVDE